MLTQGSHDCHMLTQGSHDCHMLTQGSHDCHMCTQGSHDCHMLVTCSHRGHMTVTCAHRRHMTVTSGAYLVHHQYTVACSVRGCPLGSSVPLGGEAMLIHITHLLHTHSMHRLRRQWIQYPDCWLVHPKVEMGMAAKQYKLYQFVCMSICIHVSAYQYQHIWLP